MIVDDEEWDADDIRALKRSADQMAIWKREGDARIAELEAEIADLHEGRKFVLPRTRRHALDLLKIAGAAVETLTQ